MAADAKRELFRHTVATLAYRGAKAVGHAPSEFAIFRGAGRTPAQILSHICDLLDWALSMAEGEERWNESETREWDKEVGRFFSALKAFDNYLASGKPLGASEEKLFQGPIADALTHVGQIAMLRRLAGAPMKGENYFAADITIGRVGEQQAAPVQEF